MGVIMNRKIVITLSVVVAVLFCGASVLGGLIYLFLNNPSMGEGLKNVGIQLADMPEFQSRLTEAYPCDSVEVQITNGHILDVNMVNTGFLDLSESARQEKAKEIAIFSMKNYGSINTVDTIVITFTDRITLGMEFSEFLNYVYYTKDLK